MARTTVYLDDGLRERLQRLVPHRKLNRFICEAVAEKVAALEQRQLEQAMKQGYLATRDDRAALNGDWEAVDTVDWPA
jgi:predicted transcriptional regulator